MVIVGCQRLRSSLWDVEGVGGAAVATATVAKGPVEWGRAGLSLAWGVIMVCTLQGNYAEGGGVDVCMYVHV